MKRTDSAALKKQCRSSDGVVFGVSSSHQFSCSEQYVERSEGFMALQ